MAGQCVITGPAPDGASREEEKANARLISAAPELLDALMKIADAGQAPCTDAYLPRADMMAIARAAIDKATGRTATEWKTGRL
jgi:hypothetical protein